MTDRRLIFGVLAMAVAGPSAALAEPWTLHDAVGAPAALKLSGSSRLRYESIDAQPRAGLVSSEDPVSIRTTLFAEYTAGPWRVGGEIYDSRVYGGKLGGAVGTTEANALEPVQAYVARDFKDPFGPGTKASVEIGRMLLNLGSRRLVAADDYRNTTNSETGVRVDLSARSGAAATLFLTAPQTRLPDDQRSLLKNRVELDRESTDVLLWGAIGSTPAPWGRGALLEATYVGFREKDAAGRPTRDRDLSTVGGRIVKNPAPRQFDYEAEAFYQFGSTRTGLQAAAPRQDVSAGLVHLRAGYQFADPWKTRVALEYDWVSGDGPGGKYGRFDSLYGYRRNEFGPSGIYSVVGRANISAPNLRIEVAPSARLDAFAAFRPMWLADRTDAFSTSGVRDASGRSGDYAGSQVEGRVRYWLIPNSVRLEADGAVIFKGRFLEGAPNAPADRADTRYFSLNATWSF